MQVLPYAIVLLCLLLPHFLLDRTAAAIAGYTLVMLLVMTAVSIIWTAAAPPKAGHIWVLLTALGGISFIEGLAPKVGLAPALAVSALASTWCGLWCAGAWALRRLGPGIGAAVPLLGASVCMALPVAAMPLIRAAVRWNSPGHPAWQNALVQITAHACPFFPALGALRPAVTIDWGTLPGLYAWSGLGQEIPLALPNVWLCSALYAGGAVILCLLGWLLRSTPPAPPIPPR